MHCHVTRLEETLRTALSYVRTDVHFVGLMCNSYLRSQDLSSQADQRKLTACRCEYREDKQSNLTLVVSPLSIGYVWLLGVEAASVLSVVPGRTHDHGHCSQCGRLMPHGAVVAGTLARSVLIAAIKHSGDINGSE